MIPTNKKPLKNNNQITWRKLDNEIKKKLKTSTKKEKDSFFELDCNKSFLNEILKSFKNSI